jgi:hypothetical protein
MAFADTHRTATATHSARGLRTPGARPCGILAEDARDALFVHVAQIQHIPEPGFHPGEDAVNVPSARELLEEDLERVAAMEAPRRDGTPRLIAAEIPYMIGRGRLTRNRQLGGDRPLHRHLLSPPPQRGRPHILRGYPETLPACHNDITQHSCGSET